MPDGATAEAPTIVNLSSRGAGARRNRSERRLDQPTTASSNFLTVALLTVRL